MPRVLAHDGAFGTDRTSCHSGRTSHRVAAWVAMLTLRFSIDSSLGPRLLDLMLEDALMTENRQTRRTVSRGRDSVDEMGIQEGRYVKAQRTRTLRLS